VRAWALLRYDRAQAQMDLSGTYLGIGEAAEAASGFGALGKWGGWREREETDLVTADWVLAEGNVTWFIVPTEAHPAYGWWAVERAMHLVRDCLRAIVRGRAR
jgi:hypothetical protein